MSDDYEITDRRRVGRNLPEQSEPRRSGVREGIRSWHGVDVVLRIEPDGHETLDRLVEAGPETLKSRPDTWTCPRHGLEQDLNPPGTLEADSVVFLNHSPSSG